MNQQLAHPKQFTRRIELTSPVNLAKILMMRRIIPFFNPVLNWSHKFLIAGCLIGTMSLSNADDTWQKRIGELDARHNREKVELNKKLMLELDQLIKRSVQTGDVPLANDLNARKTALENETALLSAGASEEARPRDSARSLYGKSWSLPKSRLHPAITLDKGKVYAADPSGRKMTRTVADLNPMPFLFISNRSDGGRNFYLFHTDGSSVIELTSLRHYEIKEIPRKP
jgi:hypothetical protein